jgi:hypothetical protein
LMDRRAGSARLDVKGLRRAREVAADPVPKPLPPAGVLRDERQRPCALRSPLLERPPRRRRPRPKTSSSSSGPTRPSGRCPRCSSSRTSPAYMQCSTTFVAPPASTSLTSTSAWAGQWASLMQELAQVFRQVDTHAALQLNALLCCACELIYFGRSTHMYSYMSISPAAVDLVHECWTNQQPS